MRSLRSIIAALLALALAAGMSYLLLGPYLDGRIVPGLWVWSVPVGGMTPDAARQALEAAALPDEVSVVITGPSGERWPLSLADLGVALDAEATVQATYAPGHEGDLRARLGARLRLMVEGMTLSPRFVWDEAAAWVRIERLAAQVGHPPRDAVLERTAEGFTVIPAQSGQWVDVAATLAALDPLLRRAEGGEVSLVVEPSEPQIGDAEAEEARAVAERILEAPLVLRLEGEPMSWTFPPEALAEMVVIRPQTRTIQVGLDEAALRALLQPVAEALRVEPVDARFHFDEATGELEVIRPSQAGRELDVEATVARINEVLRSGGHEVPLVVRALPPRYPDDLTAEALGIRELIAEGDSYFTGSSSTRDHNIRVGAARFDGVIIAPGETFSFNEILGEVTLEEGYEPAYVIVGDRTVEGVGGGLCQVATTVFRAAFYAGYPIIERWPHAYRVRYYELGGFGPGFDATIYAPQLDFRFVNDTPYHLLIQTEVDTAHARLRFLFFSTADGRTVEQIGPSWGDPEPPPPPIYEYDPSLPSGTVRQVELAKDGLTAVLERIVRDAEGRLLYHDRFVSHFRPWPARYRYGPGFIPPPDATIIGGPSDAP